MKKIASLILSFVMVTGLLASCGGTDTKTTTAATTAATSKTDSSNATDASKDATASSGDATGTATGNGEGMKIALLYSGFLGDKSFNDSAHEGALKAIEDFGVEIKELQSKEPTEWESNFLATAQEDYDLVICVSTQFQDIVIKHAPNFPDKKFALIDGVAKAAGGEDIPNVVSSVFAQNEGSFLAGAAAALFTTETGIEGINEDKVIGWVGGLDIPVLADFFAGYKQGALAIDPDMKVLQSFAGSFNDPLKGKEATIAQFNEKADVVMNVASGTGVGILEAANEKGKFAIGVDLDQDSVYPGHILTSMLKRVDRATYMTIESIVNDSYKGGTVTYLDISNGGVGLTDMSVMQEALGDKFPGTMLEKLAELEEKVKSGEIEVDFYEGFGKPQ